jgi:glycosyltransferase involved in cell wall biosynthesis
VKVSIAIPVYNEKSTIEEVIRRALLVDLPPGVEREIIVADDGSRDGTREILSRLGSDGVIKVHTSLINLGKGAAVRFALEYTSGTVILIQDADLELNPDEYPRLIAPILAGHADVVYGSRFMQKNPISIKTHLANRFLTFVTNVLYGSRLTDMETAYKVFRADVLRNIGLRSVGFEFEPEVTAKVLRQGIRIHEVPISYVPRGTHEGKKIGWYDGVKAIYYLLKYRMFRDA